MIPVSIFISSLYFPFLFAPGGCVYFSAQLTTALPVLPQFSTSFQQSCKVGGGVNRRHNCFRDWLCSWLVRVCHVPWADTEQQVKEWDEWVQAKLVPILSKHPPPHHKFRSALRLPKKRADSSSPLAIPSHGPTSTHPVSPADIATAGIAI